MIMKANKQIGFIYKNNESIDKILKDGEVVFEKGFLRERTTTTLPITFGGVGKDLKDYRVYGNTYQNSTSGKNICLQANIIDTNTIRFDINSNEINRTFTLSLIPPLSVNSMSIVAFADGVNLRSVGTINLISGERSTTTITLTESIYNTIQNASEVHFNLYKSGAGISTTSIIEESQIENNSSFTSYEPYTGGQPSPNPDYPQEIVSCGDLITDSQDENYGKYKIPVNVNNSITNIYLDEPLRKSDDGTYVDHIDFENKKVYRQIREITLNGTEAWSRVSAKNSHYRFRVNRSDLKIGPECVLYCTHFKNNGDSYSFEGISGSTGHVLYIRWDELFETVDDLKTWLASNTPIVDYVLDTPTEESITLPSIPTIDGNNTLNIETEITPSQVYIKYKSNE